jgi:hypothetical protein
MDYSEIKRQIEINYDLGTIRQKIKSSQYLYNKKSKRYFEITKFENNKLFISPQGRECLSQGSLSEYQIFVVREPRTVKRAYSSLKLIDAIKFLSQ